MGAAACSVVMCERFLRSAAGMASAGSWVVSRTTLRGDATGPVGQCATHGSKSPGVYPPASRFVAVRLRQRCGAVATASIGRSAHQPWRFLRTAAPTAPGPRCGPTDGPTSSTDTRLGSIPPGAWASSSVRKASTSGLTVWSTDRRSIGSVDDELDRTRARLRPGPHAIHGVDHAVLDRDDRLDPEQRADRRLRPADPAALLEVLERVEADRDEDVVGPTLDRPGDAVGRDARLRQAPRRGSRGAPAPSTRSFESTRWISRSASRSRATWALLNVPDSPEPTVTQTIASAPAAKARLERLLEHARARRRGRRKRRIRGDHPLPERLGRQVDPGPVAVRAEAHDERHDHDPETARDRWIEIGCGVGDDRDSAHGRGLLAGVAADDTGPADVDDSRRSGDRGSGIGGSGDRGPSAPGRQPRAT